MTEAATVRQPDLTYPIIEAAMDIIARRQADQPTLEELAAAVGYSPHHFQRIFTRWVGISPKRFLAYLTLDHAKAELADAASVMDAAHAAGLSGASRLHDLFVTHEAMTPGQFKARGADMVIRRGWHESPFGDCLLMESDRGIVGLAFAHSDPARGGRAGAEANMAARFPHARLIDDPGATGRTAAAIFGQDRAEVRLHLMGTNFQIRVWDALMRIPPGRLVAYGDVARAAGSPRAARAVGAAIGRNPVSWLVPCHRAVLSAGYVRGYEWGVPRKLAMIGWEASEREAASP